MHFKPLTLLIFISLFIYSGHALSALPQHIAADAKRPAESTQSYDIAIINIDKLLHECKASRQVQTELEAQRFKFQEEMKTQEEFFLDWDKKLIEQQKSMKPEEFSHIRKEFDRKLAEVHQKASQRREQLEAAFNQAMSTVQEMIFLLVRETAAHNHYKLVIPRNFVIFAEEGLEITDDLLKKLDERLPSITLKWS